MLQKMRDGAGSGFIKLILFGLLVLGVAGLVLMDVGNYFTGSVSNSVVAKVGDSEITPNQFSRSVERILSQQGLDRETAYKYGVVDQLLMGEIRDRLLAMSAAEIGLYVSDEMVAGQVREYVSPYLDSGLTAREAIQRILMSLGMTEAQFVQIIRQEMANSIVRDAITAGAPAVPSALARDLYIFEHEKRDAELLILNTETYGDIDPPEDEQISIYYESVKQSYAIPEKRGITVAHLSSAHIADTLVAPGEDDLRAWYDENIDLYTTPGERTIQHAALPDAETPRQLMTAVQEGALMEGAVRQLESEDGITCEEKRYTSPDSLDETLAGAVFRASMGQLVGPVQAQGRYHVFLVSDMTPDTTESFEDARQKVEDDLVQIRVMEQLYDMGTQIEERLASGADIDTLAKEYGLDVKAYPPFNRAGAMDDDARVFVEEPYKARRSDLLEAVFDLAPGMSSPVIELDEENYAIIRLDRIIEKSHKPLDDVRTSLLDRWEKEQKQKRRAEQADKALESLQDGGASLQDMATQFDGEIRRIEAVPRNGQSNKDLAPQIIQKMFNTSKNTWFSSHTHDGMVVGRVTSISLNEDVPEEELSRIIAQQKRDFGNELLSTYLEQLRAERSVEINREVLERMFAPREEDF